MEEEEEGEEESKRAGSADLCATPLPLVAAFRTTGIRFGRPYRGVHCGGS
jgi:hypothetical protein